MTEEQEKDLWLILDQLHDKGTLTQQDASFVYLCINDLSIDPGQAPFEYLGETIIYLRDLMDRDKLDLKGILRYWEEGIAWIDTWWSGMVDRIDQEKNN